MQMTGRRSCATAAADAVVRQTLMSRKVIQFVFALVNIIAVAFGLNASSHSATSFADQVTEAASLGSPGGWQSETKTVP